MNYLAKLDKEKINEIKRFDGYSLKFRFDMWIKHLSDEGNFRDYFALNQMKSESLFKKVRSKGLVSYTLDLNREDWNKFNKLCRSNKMSGNYALNLLVDDFVERGCLFTVSISI